MGSNLAPGLNDILPNEMILPPEDVRIYRTTTTTGVSGYLYLGYNQGYYANSLLRFNPTGALPDSFLVDSLRVRLLLDSLALDGTSPMGASAFMVNQQLTWTEIGVNWDNFNTDSLSQGLSFANIQIPVAASDSDTVRFTLPEPVDSLLRAWLSAGSGGKTLYWNNGIYLQAATDQNYMLRFASAENSNINRRPKLEMFLKNYDTTVTHGGDPVDTVLYLNAASDAFIAKDSTTLTPVDSTFIWMGNGAPYRTIMRFNIDSAFTAHYGVAVQRAELILHADTTNVLAFDHISGAYGLPMADSSWLEDPATAETTPISLPLVSLYDQATGTLALNVTTLVNDWVLHPGTHFGLRVNSSNEYQNVARMPFYGPQMLADSLKPALRIVYIQGGGGQ